MSDIETQLIEATGKLKNLVGLEKTRDILVAFGWTGGMSLPDAEVADYLQFVADVGLYAGRGSPADQLVQLACSHGAKHQTTADPNAAMIARDGPAKQLIREAIAWHLDRNKPADAIAPTTAHPPISGLLRSTDMNGQVWPGFGSAELIR